MGEAKVPSATLKYIEEYDFAFIEDIWTKYERICKIGQGTFGEVFKARDKKTKQLVAAKKILMENEKEGFPITALREIKMLHRLKHDNITELLEICGTKASSFNRNRSTFYLIFTFCEHDLAGLLSNHHVKFTLGEIKCIMKQMLEGLYHIHHNKILHRDMKAANVLITKHGILKLADFGLSRPILKRPGESEFCFTNRVVTLWYRPPELLLGERNYATAIDMWGAGCIMAELWTRCPIMQGDTEQKQLKLICQLCGSITPEVWPNVEKLAHYDKLKDELLPGMKRRVRDRLCAYVKDGTGVDLIDRFLSLDPKSRPDAETALNHTFFWTDPMPSPLKNNATFSKLTQSMFEYTAPRKGAGGGGRGNHPGGAPAHPKPGEPPGGPHVGQGQLHDRVF